MGFDQRGWTRRSWNVTTRFKTLAVDFAFKIEC